ncbi:MAG: hypothetical protein M3036_08010 [Bifidobacteriales bacterium]|nr:hypothetical protein [Bifidobacteriales bacterium]
MTFLGGERDGQDYYEIIPLSIIVTQDLVVTVRIQNTVLLHSLCKFAIIS